MEGPTSVSVETLDGEPIVGARKTDGTALLDLESGAARVTAERPIQSLRLERYVSRRKGMSPAARERLPQQGDRAPRPL
jgi:hypothetical protein